MNGNAESPATPTRKNMEVHESMSRDETAGPSTRKSRSRSRRESSVRARERRRRILRSPSRSRSRSRDQSMEKRSRSKSTIYDIIENLSRHSGSDDHRRRRLSDEHEQRSTCRHFERSSGGEHEQRLLDRRNSGLRNESEEQEQRSHCRDRTDSSRGNGGELERHHYTTRVLPSLHYDHELHSNKSRDRSRSKHSFNCTNAVGGPTHRESSKTPRHTRSEPSANRESGVPLNVLNQFIEAIKNVKSGSHNITSVANVIPQFDPLVKSQTILSWLTKVEECADIYEWDERETIHYALPKLCGLARTWYQSLPTVKYTWVEWKNKLIETFPCSENHAELLSEMLNLKVKYGEPLEQYCYSKLNLLNRCQISGRKAVDCILHGIEDRAIKLGAQAASYSRPEQVLTYLKTVKVAQVKSDIANAGKYKSDRKTQSPPANYKSINSKSTITCFNCGTEGHPSFKCTKPLEKCSNCHKLGHRTTACRLLKNSDTIKESSGEKQVMKLHLEPQCQIRSKSPSDNEV